MHDRRSYRVKNPPIRIALAAVAVVVLALVPPALAGKTGGQSSGGTSSLNVASPLVNDVNGNGQANWGDILTFKVSTTATNTPEVGLSCSQNGTEVYYHYGGFYPGD